jgi:hypothetical protein
MARHGLKSLFEEELYDVISRIKPETAFQLYLLDSNLWHCGKELAKHKAYIKNLRSYAHLSVCSMAVRAFQEAGAKWGDPVLTALFQSQWTSWGKHERGWLTFTKLAIDLVLRAYKKEAKNSIHKETAGLNYPNFF